MTTKEYRDISDGLPKQPGVYQFKDNSGTTLYVGKAKNLRKRLDSYFGNKKHQAFKTRVMVRNASYIDFTIVDSEQDALLLENTLIKKIQPRYNVMLKDGKSYTYICVKNEHFPRVFFTRNVVRDGSVYFGPYTSKFNAKILFEMIRKLFPIRTCTLALSPKNIDEGKFKVCLEYHIKNCLGPCVAYESEENYDERISQIKNILKGHFKPVKDYILAQMNHEVNKMHFEQAQIWKEKLNLLEDYQSKSTVVSTTVKDVDVFAIATDQDSAYVNYLKVVNGAIINSHTAELTKNLTDNKKDILRYSILQLRDKFNSVSPEVLLPFKVSLPDTDFAVLVPQRGDKKKLVELSEKNVDYFLRQKKRDDASKLNKKGHAERILNTLKSDLQMSEIPFHIECFDNSNIQGTNPVASCVVFKNAKPSKKDYRHFNIKTVEGPNDFASMEEVVRRRYSRLIKDNEPLPQLVIIDGGKGQLSSAFRIMQDLGIEHKVTLIGIAKKLEEIFFPGDKLPLYINKKSESLKLIQHARNEAHRFAINFHRDQRSRNFIQTELTEIPGIGEKTAEKLLAHFKSVERIKQTRFSELSDVIGKANAKKILDHFKAASGNNE